MPRKRIKKGKEVKWNHAERKRRNEIHSLKEDAHTMAHHKVIMLKNGNKMTHDTYALELILKKRLSNTFVKLKLSCYHSTIKQ